MIVDKLTEIPRKALPVILAIDSSASMNGEKIQSVQAFLNDFPNIAPELARTLSARIQIGILEFNSTSQWLTQNGFEDMEEDFVPVQLKASGSTQVGDMLEKLDAALSIRTYLSDPLGCYMPAILFITDGMSTQEYSHQLEKIRENKWFRNASKIGIAVGSDADTTMIANLAGDVSQVITLNDVSLLTELIKAIVITTSMVNSGTRTSMNQSSEEATMQEARKLVGGDPEVRIGDENEVDPTEYIPEQKYEEPLDPWRQNEWTGARA